MIKSRWIQTLFVVGLATSSWAYSFKERSVTSGTDHAELGLASQHGGEDVLLGSYDGTTFSITLKSDRFAGMGSFPFGICYGASSRYVWVYSHNRATDGTVLIDVETGASPFGAHGHGSDVSPDGWRSAYSINGMYGLFDRACVNNFAVYPEIAQMQSDSGGHMSHGVPRFETPQMAMTAYHEWLDNDTICFVHGEHTRVAEQANMPELAKYWFVQVNGVGERMTTESVRASRARLNDDEVRRLLDTPDVSKTNWPYKELALACKDRLAPVTAASFEHDVFSHPDWPVLPVGANDKSYTSPDGSHVITLGRDRIETDMSYGPVVMFDGKEIVSWPLGRVLASPVWTSNNSAEFMVQEGWVERVLTGKGETVELLVRVSLTNGHDQPQLAIQKISKKDADERVNLAGKTGS